MSRTKIEKNIAWDDVRNVYYVTLNFSKDANGKYNKKCVTCSSKKEARQLLREHNAKMEAGTAVHPVKDTLADYTRDFIDYKATSLAKSTIYGYRNIHKNHISPYFKKKRIQDITPKDIQDYVSAKVKSGLSMASVKKHTALLYSVFKNAYVARIISENPLDRMDRLKTKSYHMDCMNTTEIAKLCASVHGTQLEVPVILACYLGLRRGEILGLKWEHIDFETATLYVENTRTMVGKDVVEKAPKTERSTRQLHLDPYLLELLLTHKEKRRKNIQHDYVVTMSNGNPFKPNYLSEAFHKHIIKHNMKPIRFHDLRHSFASIANDAGMQMNEISAAMGHSSISVTSTVYTHEFSQKKTKAVNAVAMSIERAKHQEISV